MAFLIPFFFFIFPFGTVQSFVGITSLENLNSIIECDIANKVENNKMAIGIFSEIIQCVCCICMVEGEMKEKTPAEQNSIDQMGTWISFITDHLFYAKQKFLWK